MIYLRSVIACDKRTLSVSNITSNLDQVPNWIAGNSLELYTWSIDVVHSEDTVTLTNLSYPINVHIDMGSDVTLSRVKIYRMIDINELHFDITPTSTTGQLFDFHFEFIEKSE